MQLRRITSLFTATVIAATSMFANFPALTAHAAEGSWAENGDGSFSYTQTSGQTAPLEIYTTNGQEESHEEIPISNYNNVGDWYLNANDEWVFSTDNDLFCGEDWNEVPALAIDISSVVPDKVCISGHQQQR